MSSNTLRLLKLPDSVKAYINAGKITAGHARALIGQPNPEELAHEIVTKGLNVRQIEQAREQDKSGKKGKTGKKRKDPNTAALERSLTDTLGLAVEINHRGRGGSREDQVQDARSARRRHAPPRGPEAVRRDRRSVQMSKPRRGSARNSGSPELSAA